MPKPEIWGPPIWKLFHAFTINLKPEFFDTTGVELFFYLKALSNYLPCPDCSRHSREFYAKINPKSIKDKQSLVNIFYILHNNVNIKKRKSPFSIEDLKIYEYIDLCQVFNSFSNIYIIHVQASMLSDILHRNMLFQKFRKWFMTNINKFYNPSDLPPTIEPVITSNIETISPPENIQIESEILQDVSETREVIPVETTKLVSAIQPTIKKQRKKKQKVTYS